MSTIKRRRFLRLFGAGTAAAFSPLAFQKIFSQPNEKPPNFLFIMADDLGYGHLGCYGQEKIRTPNIDRLAAEGIKFTEAYAGCTVCAPSRSTLMTGYHMGHTPVRGNSGGIPLRDEDITLAEILKEAGYATGCFGKWGLGEAGTAGVPTRQGFDEFVGYLHQIHAHFYYPRYIWKNEKKWPLPDNQTGDRLPAHAGYREHKPRTQYAPDEIQQHALNFIRANRDRPFFCYVPSIIPHSEYVAEREWMEEYLDEFEDGMNEQYNDSRPGYNDPSNPRATYAAMVTRLDTHVGQIMELLEDLDLDENTVVIFTSDNGGSSSGGGTADFFNPSGPLRGHKTDMYEGGLRAPMIVRWPKKIKPGQVNRDLAWYFPDVLPTFAELAGVKAPAEIDGISVVPALIGEKAAGHRQEHHEYLYWEYRSGPRLTQAVRTGDWKAVKRNPESSWELYNLAEDLGETNNVANRNRKIVSRIERYVQETRQEPRPQVEPVKIQGRRYR